MNYPKRKIVKGESDAKIVKAIQRALNDAGCGPVEVIGIFGPKTFQGVKLFQSLHRDRFGNPLVMDGEVGAFTWEALFGPDTVPAISQPTTELFTQVLQTAAGELGIMEIPRGSNSGPRINQYLASVNLGPGFFWCAAFVYWCFNESYKNLNRNNPVFKTAGCMHHWNKTTVKKITKDEAVNNPGLIKPAHIFIINHGGGKGHTGIVERVQGGSIYTIEGNSNTDGSRNGIGVFRLPIPRKINSISAGFIEYK